MILGLEGYGYHIVLGGDVDASDAPSWSLIHELGKSKDQSSVYQARFSHPVCTTLQLGLIALPDF